MKFRHKLLFPPFLALLFGLFASASTLAARRASPAGAVLPPEVENLPPFMVSAGSLGNAEYMACIRAKLKLPAAANAVANVKSALDCQDSKD